MDKFIKHITNTKIIISTIVGIGFLVFNNLDFILKYDLLHILLNLSITNIYFALLWLQLLDLKKEAVKTEIINFHVLHKDKKLDQYDLQILDELDAKRKKLGINSYVEKLIKQLKNQNK